MDVDVIVLGGGIVGLTMANLLARNQNLKITLLDPQVPLLEWDTLTYDLRCSAITQAAQNIFADLGVWDEIIAQRFGYYDQMSVWDQELHQQINFNAAALGADNLGYIIENRIITRALYTQLMHYCNVEIIHAAADSLGPKLWQAKLIIGADGANSWLRTQMQMETYGWDYQHSALVATIQTQFPHANIAMQRFMPDGPLAFLPLAEQDLCSIVWSSNPQKIQTLMQLDVEEFCSQLASEFGFRLGTLKLQGERASFALRMLHAKNYVRSGVALIGDAAHVIHPLAGQGLNLGILDAAVLAEVLQQAMLQQQDLGALNVLRKYERRRKGHNLGMIVLMEGIKRMFASEHKTMAGLRAQGINLANNLGVIKNSMIRFATGMLIK